MNWWAHHDSNLSIPSNLHLLWTLPTRPEQLKRPVSGRFDTGQSTRSVQFLDALLGSHCVVF